jgi:hypothetical protein
MKVKDESMNVKINRNEVIRTTEYKDFFKKEPQVSTEQ